MTRLFLSSSLINYSFHWLNLDFDVVKWRMITIDVHTIDFKVTDCDKGLPTICYQQYVEFKRVFWNWNICFKNGTRIMNKSSSYYHLFHRSLDLPIYLQNIFTSYIYLLNKVLNGTVLSTFLCGFIFLQHREKQNYQVSI